MPMPARSRPELPQSGQPEWPLAAPATSILTAINLLRCPGKLFDRVIAFANRGGELFTKAFGRLPKIVPALSGGFGERRIGEMRPVADAGTIFFELDLPFKVGSHLVEFADNPLQVFDFPRFFLHLAALQAQGGFT